MEQGFPRKEFFTLETRKKAGVVLGGVGVTQLATLLVIYSRFPESMSPQLLLSLTSIISATNLISFLRVLHSHSKQAHMLRPYFKLLQRMDYSQSIYATDNPSKHIVKRGKHTLDLKLLDEAYKIPRDRTT